MERTHSSKKLATEWVGLKSKEWVTIYKATAICKLIYIIQYIIL